MHPTSSGAKGYTEDVGIAYREQERMQRQVYRLISQHSGLSVEKIDELFRRDKFMNAVEAKEYGLVDELLGEAQLL
jgi:ATP-dependent Clp protease protease subunit